MNPYAVLGVPQGASLEEVKSAYRRLAKQFHPDRNPGGTERFKEAEQAYSMIAAAHRASEPAVKRRRFKMAEKPVKVEATAPQVACGGQIKAALPKIRTCPKCGGAGATGSEAFTCLSCDGTGHLSTSFSSFPCPKCDGSGRIPVKHCWDCLGSGEVIDQVPSLVEIPADAPLGEVVEAIVPGGSPVKVIIELRDGDGFEVRNNAPLKRAIISLGKALTGGQIEVAGPSGRIGGATLPRPCPPGYETLVPLIGLRGNPLCLRIEVDLPELDDRDLSRVLEVLER